MLITSWQCAHYKCWVAEVAVFSAKKFVQKRLHLERASSKLLPFQDGFAYFPVPRVWPWAERLLAFLAVAARCFHSLRNLNKSVRFRVPDTFDPTGRWMVTHFRSVSNATWEEQPDNLETYVWFEADKSYAGLLNGLQLSKGTYSVDGRKIRVKLSGGTQSQMEVDYVVDENTIEVVLYDADFKKAQGLQRLKRIHYPKTLEQAEEIFLGQWRVPDSELGMAFDEGYLDFVSLSEMRAVFHVKSNAAGSDKWYTPYKGRYVGYVASTACRFKYDAADMTGMFIYYSSGSQMPLFTLNSLCDRSFLLTENGSKEAMLMIRPAEPVKYTLIDKPE